MWYWIVLTVTFVAACRVSFLIGQRNPSMSVRIDMTERLWRRLIEKAMRHFCTGDGWQCIHDTAEFGTVARLVRGDEILILPDATSIPAGAIVLFSPRLAPKKDRRMPRMCGFEDWLEM